MLKKLVIALLVLIVIVGAGAIYMWSNLDYLIKVAVEKYGTAATQSEVSLASVKLSLTTGEGSLDGLSIGNPKGFSSGPALYLGSIDVKVDTSSLRGTGPIVITSVIIEKPQVTYEIANDGSNNLKTIARNTQSYAHTVAGGGNAPANEASAKASASPGRKVIIDNLMIRDGQVGVSQSMLKGKTLTAPLPPIHLTNIGKSSGGASAAQVAEQVLGPITADAAEIAATQFAGQLTGALKGVGGTVGNAVNGVVPTSTGNIGGQLKSLIGQ